MLSNNFENIYLGSKKRNQRFGATGMIPLKRVLQKGLLQMTKREDVSVLLHHIFCILLHVALSAVQGVESLYFQVSGALKPCRAESATCNKRILPALSR